MNTMQVAVLPVHSSCARGGVVAASRSARILQHRDAPRLARSTRQIRCAAASTDSPSSRSTPVMPTDAALRVLHAAADGSTPDAKDVFEAIRAISKAKLPVDFASTIAGPGSTMRHWQLLFTANGNDLNAANAGKPSKVGNYWLTSVLPACLGYSQDGGHDNGVYLASGAVSLRFSGLYDLQSNKVGFDFGSVAIKLGPWSLPIVLKKQVPARYDNPASAPGLFVMIYADDKVMVARGKSGGVALWARAKPSWLLKNGIA